MTLLAQAWDVLRHHLALERSLFVWFCATFDNMLSTIYQFSSVLNSGFNQLQMALALQFGSCEVSRMMTLDWRVLIVAFVAISLQIITSMNLMFGRSAVKKCNIWREKNHSLW